MKRLPKPILHVRIPPLLGDLEDEIYDQLKSVAKEYVVIVTTDSPDDKTEMQVHSIIPNELSEEKATEIIELLKNMK